MDDVGLTVTKKGQVLVLCLDRPMVRNALGTALVASLLHSLESAEDDPSTTAVLLHGADPGFCAGSDLKELAMASVGGMRLHERRSAELTRCIAGMRKPVVAAVEGFAMGGGFFLAIACDVVVSATNVRWHLPEVGLGWVPPWGLQLLSARVGPVTARRLTWGLDELSSVEAYRLGVVDVLIEDGGAMDLAMTIASRLSTMPDTAVQATKRLFAPLVLNGAASTDEDALDRFAANVTAPESKATMERFRSSR